MKNQTLEFPYKLYVDNLVVNADNLVLNAESESEAKELFKKWKSVIENKFTLININKMKIVGEAKEKGKKSDNGLVQDVKSLFGWN